MNKSIYCPICRDIFVNPRLYECGHTVCKKCMIMNDEQDIKMCSIVTIFKYKCPICREPTYKDWKRRPVNISLSHLLEEIPEYTERYEIKVLSSPVIIDSNFENPVEDLTQFNLSDVCSTIRKDKMLNIYRQLLPILYESAKRGEHEVVVPYIDIFCDFSNVADLLSEKLFREQNIYDIFCRSKHAIIRLIKIPNREYPHFINDITEDSESE